MTLPTYRRFGLVLATALAFIALLHAYWALGGRWGLQTGLGGPGAPVPPPALIWLVTALLLAAAFLVLGRLGLWGRRVPPRFFALGCWGLAAALLGAAGLNATARTAWERFGFAPLAAVLAALAVVVARGPRSAA